MQETCKVEGCKKAYRAKGYCNIHYKKWRAGELPKPRYKICKMENCKKPMLKKGICKAHFDAMILEKNKPVVGAAQPPQAPAPESQAKAPEVKTAPAAETKEAPPKA